MITIPYSLFSREYVKEKKMCFGVVILGGSQSLLEQLQTKANIFLLVKRVCKNVTIRAERICWLYTLTIIQRAIYFQELHLLLEVQNKRMSIKMIFLLEIFQQF